MKNRCIQWLVNWLKPRVSKSSEGVRRFLVVSTTALGDTLWATPALKELRSFHPTAHITVLTSSIGREVLAVNPSIDHLIVLKKPLIFSLIALFLSLRREHLTDVFVFHASQRAIFPLIAVLGAERLVGTAGINKGLDGLFTELVDSKGVHEIQRRLDIVGCSSPHPSLELFLNLEDEEIAHAFLSRFNLDPSTKLIGIHPGAKDRFKQWPPSHFIALGNRLVQEKRCQLFVTGVPSEKKLVDEIASQIPGAIAVTELPLRAFGAFLKRLSVFICNDTGSMHVAFAMKTPTVALFAPTDPLLCGPYFNLETAICIAKKRTCAPCLVKKCREPFCLLQIGVAEVYDVVGKL